MELPIQGWATEVLARRLTGTAAKATRRGREVQAYSSVTFRDVSVGSQHLGRPQRANLRKWIHEVRVAARHRLHCRCIFGGRVEATLVGGTSS
ncbi:hypothetical protein JG687_00017317 [Phytophthora cactorum]|uniref:Uncharacterized protein n=1 Tax=Phytophthora cactorum TaxID=29920 RepID=A0A8T1TQK8_9STRA|nr:hypothetical protein JG687_00017317 [Phytophthora cactorum]